MRIHLVGPVNQATGYALITREIALALLRQGVEIYLEPLKWGPPLILPGKSRETLEKLKQRQGNYDYLLSVGIPPLFAGKGPKKMAIGLTMLEVDGVPASWVDICNRLDEIWVPSSFNQRTFQKSGVQGEKIVVMPLGVNTAVFHPGHVNRPVIDQKPFTFLSVFEWNLRKGYDILLEAYLQEFSAVENVSLIIKSYSNRGVASRGKHISQQIKHFSDQAGRINSPCVRLVLSQGTRLNESILSYTTRKKPAITLIPHIITTAEMAALYRSADCFVLPTRGEGWNLTVLEAMASGIPVITTAWSAHMDFVTEENCYLINVQRLEPVPKFGLASDKIYQGFQWAKPDTRHFRKLMREVYNNRDIALKKAQKARADVEKLTWDAAAKRMVTRLRS